MNETPTKTATVTIYSAPWCVYCKMAKEYLKTKGIDYKDINIEEDRAAAKHIVEKTGQAGIPVIEIGDEVILGFDRPKIDEALAKAKLV